jgi:hypothetical protein
MTIGLLQLASCIVGSSAVQHRAYRYRKVEAIWAQGGPYYNTTTATAVTAAAAATPAAHPAPETPPKSATIPVGAQQVQWVGYSGPIGPGLNQRRNQWAHGHLNGESNHQNLVALDLAQVLYNLNIQTFHYTDSQILIIYLFW